MTIYALPEHEFIEVGGPDARKFLQGQTSCDMEQLSATRSLPGAICDLKGRVIADFRLAQRGDSCLMRTTGGMAEKIIETLSRYAIFSKVELRRVEPPLALGLLGDGFAAALSRIFAAPPAAVDASAVSSQLCLLRLPGERQELWCLDETVIPSLRELLGEWQPAPGREWLAAMIEAGVAHVGPANSGRYTPQLLNYDLSGVVNFAKGCYTGQEVVARMHFRGKPKKRMFLFRGETEFASGGRVCDQAGANPRGEPLLAYVNRARSGNLALAVANIGMVAEGRPWYLDGCADAPLRAAPLSYDRNADGA